MPKKKSSSIGSNVLKKGKSIVPSKVELTLKPPYPLDIIQLKLEWERKEKRKLSEEEFRRRLQEYFKKTQKESRRMKKMPKQVKYI